MQRHEVCISVEFALLLISLQLYDFFLKYTINSIKLFKNILKCEILHLNKTIFREPSENIPAKIVFKLSKSTFEH